MAATSIKLHPLWLVCLALPLVACSNGADQRKALAQCQMQKQATGPEGWNFTYLRTCMQAKGYVQDLGLMSGGSKCIDLPGPADVADGYRADTWWSEQLAKWRNKAS